MSYCGYTTETFAIVYALFDAFYMLGADSSQKFWTPTLEKKVVGNRIYCLTFFSTPSRRPKKLA